MKAAKRTEKKLKHAEETRSESNPSPVEEMGGDADLLRKKMKEWADKVGSDVLMQFETFLDAVEKMSEEKPAVALQAV